MNLIHQKISDFLGFDIAGEDKKTYLTRNQIFSKKFFLPFNHAHSVKIGGQSAEHLSGFFYTLPPHTDRDPLVSYSVGGVDFISQIQPITTELERIYTEKEKLQKSDTIKSKKIEDLSVTYTDASTTLSVLEKEEQKLFSLLRPYKNFYVA